MIVIQIGKYQVLINWIYTRKRIGKKKKDTIINEERTKTRFSSSF
jgi:hypothetical protein